MSGQAEPGIEKPLAPTALRQQVVGATRWDKVREVEGFQTGDRDPGKKRRGCPLAPVALQQSRLGAGPGATPDEWFMRRGRRKDLSQIRVVGRPAILLTGLQS